MLPEHQFAVNQLWKSSTDIELVFASGHPRC